MLLFSRENGAVDVGRDGLENQHLLQDFGVLMKVQLVSPYSTFSVAAHRLGRFRNRQN
jgi:hypothetical protein